MIKKLGLVACTFLFTASLYSVSLAGDYADFKFIGFSVDGKYMAFEESGEYDGSGGNYANTYYIDVAKNSYAAPPTLYEWDTESMKELTRKSLLARYNTGVAAGLDKLKIVRGNTGKQVVAHMLTDWSYIKPVESESYWMKDGKDVKKKMPNYEGAFLSRGGETETVIFNPWLYPNNFNTDTFYELTLKKVLSKTVPCDIDDAYKIELTLKDNAQHQDTNLQVLQKDSEIPKSRSCPYGYRIEQVYFYKDNIAVFLNVFRQGFEGPDMRYMAVTGKLAYKSHPPGE